MTVETLGADVYVIRSGGGVLEKYNPLQLTYSIMY